MKDLTSEERNINPYLHIDPGFINYRKCFSTFGQQFIKLYNHYSSKDAGHLAKLENDHLFVDLALKFCKENNVKSLGEVLNDPKEHTVFCSVEKLEGTEEVYVKRRVINRILLPYEYEKQVYLEFGPEHLVCDTGRAEQSQQSKVSIIGEIRKINNDRIIIYPIIMGAETISHPFNKNLISNPTWDFYEWYENFPEDIDEFSKIKEIDEPPLEEWMEYMKNLSEYDLKRMICEIINDIAKPDWGGEQDDIFSVSIHLSGKRVPTAFLLKGPAKFSEMTPKFLGKNGDQINRLSNTPARLLIVQHCHSIGKAVREMLRAFAVRLHDPRRFCLIDGKDTYKILKAYGKI